MTFLQDVNALGKLEASLWVESDDIAAFRRLMKRSSGFEEEDAIITSLRRGGMGMMLWKEITNPPSDFKSRTSLGEVSFPSFFQVGTVTLLASSKRVFGIQIS